MLFALALLLLAPSAFAGEVDSGSIQTRVTSRGLPPDHGKDLTVKAVALSTMGSYDESERLFKEALAYWQKSPPKDILRRASCLNNLALLYEKENRLAEAVPLYKEALAIEETQSGNDQSLALTLDNLAQVYRRQGQFDEAEPLYKKALKIEEKIMKPDDQDHAITMFNLSLLYFGQGKYQLCEPLMVRSLAVLKNTLGETSPSYLNIYPYYLSLLRKTNRASEADRVEAELKKKLQSQNQATSEQAPEK